MSIALKEVGIATTSTHWKLASGKVELVKQIESYIKDDQHPGPHIPYPLSDTVFQSIELFTNHSK